MEKLTDDLWHAILENDASYNGQFFYAVKTTGIFCRPSCKSRPPKRENVLIFQVADEALSKDFRPCKRCKPVAVRLPDEEWVAEIARYIDKHFNEKLSLATLSEIVHGSPYHLQRTFKKIMGISPAQYIQTARITQAKKLLHHTNLAVVDIACAVGISNVSYFVSLFKRNTGFTPTAYRQLKKKEEKSCQKQFIGQ